jgi:16S rRNA processing protein RimM
MIKRDIAIGKIVGTYGNRGMLKVLPLTDFPDRFLNMDRVCLELKGKQIEYGIAEARRHHKYILIKFREITDMSMAEALRGGMIMIGREELTALPEDTYYIFDIIGLEVYTSGGNLLGVVEDIIQTGANDVYVVGTGNKNPVLVPALKDVVREVDIKSGRMIIDYSENGY